MDKNIRLTKKIFHSPLLDRAIDSDSKRWNHEYFTIIKKTLNDALEEKREENEEGK